MKQLFLTLIYFLSIASAVGQDYTALHSKYWYYRTRLRNDFMKVGIGQGCSIPMEQRGLGYEPNTFHYNFPNPGDGAQAQWGDAMGELGYYIGILATEYRLLSLNNQETDSVRYELYCALEALNRMDYWAENAFNQATGQSHPSAHNGFMVRDDVPIDFIQNNMNSFNYFGNKGFCSKIKLNTVVSSSGNDAITPGHKASPNQSELVYAGSYISQDNWINCLVGLALVRKFVPHGQNYKHQYFSDGPHEDFNEEAFVIGKRVMDYFKADASWLLKYPSGTFIGSDWGGIGTGLAFAHAEALNKMALNKWGHYVMPDFFSFDNWCEYNDWRHDGNTFVQIIKNVFIIPWMYMSYVGVPHAQGSLGNIFTQLPLTIMPNGEETYKGLQLYPNFNNKPDVDVQVSNISAIGNCEYTFRGVDTKHQLQHHINASQIWHPELLRVALHGEGNCFATNLNPSYYNAAVSLISNAPCEGPYNWIRYEFNNGSSIFHLDGPDSPNKWHTQSQLDHPEGRDANGLTGEFNGIDYMLYHNLINIVDIEKNGINDSKKVVDFGRRHISASYPTSVAAQNWGSYNLPATVKSFEYIVGNNIINSNANVTYLAGKEITLSNGFSSINSCSFTAAIQQLNCSEIMSNPLDHSTNARIASKSKTKTGNETIYPDMLATSYAPSEIIEKEDVENTAKTKYTPTLIHVDSSIVKPATILNSNLVAELAPNPSTGLTKLFVTKPELIKSIDVIDPLGHLMFALTTVSFSNDIELSGMGKGVFSIIIKGIENDVLVKKVVIQ